MEYIQNEFTKELSAIFLKHKKRIELDKEGMYIVDDENGSMFMIRKPTMATEGCRDSLLQLYTNQQNTNYKEDELLNKKSDSSILHLVSKTPLNDYYKGIPCMFGDVVGRIVCESEKGSWVNINDVNFFSIPLFSTPHGTVVETGIRYLSKITNDGLLKLYEYERQVIDDKGILYAGYFDVNYLTKIKTKELICLQ